MNLFYSQKNSRKTALSGKTIALVRPAASGRPALNCQCLMGPAIQSHASLYLLYLIAAVEWVLEEEGRETVLGSSGQKSSGVSNVCWSRSMEETAWPRGTTVIPEGENCL